MTQLSHVAPRFISYAPLLTPPRAAAPPAGGPAVAVVPHGDMDPPAYPTNLLIRKGLVYATPVLGAGAGILAGLHGGWAGGIGGLVVGGTVGGGIGALVGAGIDLIRNIGGSKGMKYTALGLLGGGLATGGVGAYLAAAHPGPLVATLLGAVGLVSSGFIAMAMHGKVKRQDRQVHQEQEFLRRKADSFQAVYDKTVPAPPAGAHVLRAMRQLEDGGWRFNADGKAEQAFGQFLEGNHLVELSPRTRQARPQPVPIEHLPVLSFFAGSGDLSGVDHPDLAQRIKEIAEKEQLVLNGYRSHLNPAERAVESTHIYKRILGGESVVLQRDEVPYEFTAASADDLVAAVHSVSDLSAQAKRVLDPAIAAGDLDRNCRREVLTAAYHSPLGADLSTTVPLLVQLTKLVDEPDTSRCTRQAVDIFKKLSEGNQGDLGVPEGIALLSGWRSHLPMNDCLKAVDHLHETLPNLVLPGENVRYKANFSRLFNATADFDTAVRAARLMNGLTPQVADEHLSLIVDLAKAAESQKSYKGVVLDYATIVAGRAMGKEPAVPQFKQLLTGLAHLGRAEDAAPTYAFLRQGVARGSFGARGLDDVTNDFLTAVTASGKPSAARMSLLQGTPSAGAPDPAQREAEIRALGAKLPKEIDSAAVADAAGDVIAACDILPPQDKERYTQTYVRLASATADVKTAARGTALLQNLPAAVADEHVGVIEKLAGAAREQKGYHGVLLDYVTLLAARDPQQPLEESTRTYTDLLTGLSMMGKAEEAGVTYAFLRDGQAHQRFGNATMGDLTNKFLTTVVINPDCHNARQRLLAGDAEASKPGRVQQDDGAVWIGSVRVPRKQG